MVHVAISLHTRFHIHVHVTAPRLGLLEYGSQGLGTFTAVTLNRPL
jgi:hypothetical protein